MITYTIETSAQNEEQLGFDSCKGNKKDLQLLLFQYQKAVSWPIHLPLLPLPHQCLSVLKRPTQTNNIGAEIYQSKVIFYH